MTTELNLNLNYNGTAVIRGTINVEYATHDRAVKIFKQLTEALFQKETIPPYQKDTQEFIKVCYEAFAKKEDPAIEPPITPQQESSSKTTQPELKTEILAQVKTSRTKPAPNNKWQIPFDYQLEHKKYNKAYQLCRKYMLKYPEALKRQEEDNKVFGITTTDIPASAQIPDLYLAYMPTSAPGTEEHIPKYTTHLSGIVPSGLKIGDHVKQIKKYLDRQVSGIGVVKSFKNGLVEVNFKGTQYYKIAPDCLEVQ